MDVTLPASLPDGGNGLKYRNQRLVIRWVFPGDAGEALLQVRFVADLVTVLRKACRIISRRSEGHHRNKHLKIPALHQVSVAAKLGLQFISTVVLSFHETAQVTPFDEIEYDKALLSRYQESVDGIRPFGRANDRIADVEKPFVLLMSNEEVGKALARDGFLCSSPNNLDHGNFLFRALTVSQVLSN